MVNKGTLVKVEFDAWTAEGDLFDTTSKETAKAAGKLNENVPYGPMPAVVGAGRLIPGFDKALMEAKVGEEREVTIPPEDAFGERDASKVETVPLREFQKQDVAPHPGMRVNYQGRAGTVSSVSPGRVRIDYNPPLAGKTLRYKFKIVEEVTDPAAKIAAIIDLDYGMGRSEGFDVKVDGEAAEIKLPDSCKYDQRWFVAKYRIVSDLRVHAAIKTVRFVEEYVTEESPVPPDAPPAEASPESAQAPSP